MQEILTATISIEQAHRPSTKQRTTLTRYINNKLFIFCSLYLSFVIVVPLLGFVVRLHELEGAKVAKLIQVEVLID